MHPQTVSDRPLLPPGNWLKARTRGFEFGLAPEELSAALLEIAAKYPLRAWRIESRIGEMPPPDQRLREAPLEGLFADDPRLDTLHLRPADLPLPFAPDVWLDGKAFRRARRSVAGEMAQGAVTLQLFHERCHGKDGLDLRVMSLGLIAEVARYEGPEGGWEDMEHIAFPRQAKIFGALKRRIGKVAVHRLMETKGARSSLCMKVSAGFADWSRARGGALPPSGMAWDEGHAPEG